MNWTQKEITEWATQTFGEPASNWSLVGRTIDEFKELVALYDDGVEPDPDDVCEEIADIVIVLSQVVERCGRNLQTCIDDKMTVNSMRTWVKTGEGIGHHHDGNEQV